MHGLFSRHFISANLASLLSSESYEGSHTTTVNTHLLPAADQHGFWPGHSTTSTTDDWCCDRLQSNETATSNYMCCCWRRHSIQCTITYCYQRLQDQRFRRQPVDGYELLQRQTISYKLQRCQVGGKNNPYWCSTRLEVVTYAVQFLHSWLATADRASQVDLLGGIYNRVGLRSKHFGTRANS